MGEVTERFFLGVEYLEGSFLDKEAMGLGEEMLGLLQGQRLALDGLLGDEFLVGVADEKDDGHEDGEAPQVDESPRRLFGHMDSANGRQLSGVYVRVALGSLAGYDDRCGFALG